MTPWAEGLIFFLDGPLRTWENGLKMTRFFSTCVNDPPPPGDDPFGIPENTNGGLFRGWYRVSQTKISPRCGTKWSLMISEQLRPVHNFSGNHYSEPDCLFAVAIKKRTRLNNCLSPRSWPKQFIFCSTLCEI